MSLEQNIARITDALESIVLTLNEKNQTSCNKKCNKSREVEKSVPTPQVPEVPTPQVPEVPTPQVPEVPTPQVPEVPTPQVPEVPTPQVPEVPTPQVPKSTMTAQELNDKVSEECERLGLEDPTPVFNIIKKYGAPTLSSLDPQHYGSVLNEIKGL